MSNRSQRDGTALALAAAASEGPDEATVRVRRKAVEDNMELIGREVGESDGA